MRILLSIKPEYVDKIFNGEKKFEYRKSIFKRKNIDTIVVYSTMPVGKIVGEFKIKDILNDSPQQIWGQTKQHGGVEKNFFNAYFEGRSKAYAIEIGHPVLYERPINPKEENENFIPPQSFMYLN